MKPTEEEIAQRQQQLRRQAQQRLAQAGAAKRPAPQAAVQAAPAPTPVAPASNGGSNAMAIIALLLALVAAGAAGYLFMQLQAADQKFANAERLLQQQASDIGELQDKLSMSGENANLSVDALKVVLREQDQEIRKLWDIASKRNRSDIDANTEKLGQLNGALSNASGASSADLVALRQSQAAAAKTQAALQRDLDALEAAVAGMPGQLELAIAQNKETIDLFDASVASLRESVEGMGSGSGGGASYGELANMKLEIEDIQIRLDRIQNAMAGR